MQAPGPVQQAFLGGPAERRAVGVGGAEVGVPGVQVRVEVDHGHRAVHRRDRTEHRQRHGVVTAERQHEPRAFQQGTGAPLDRADRVVDVERVDRQVARVGDLLAGEYRHLQGRVVRPEQAGRFADVGRPEAGAGPVADPAVEGHAQDGHIGLAHLVDARQPGEGGLPGVSGYRGGVHRPDGVAGDDPRNGIGHVTLHPWVPARLSGLARRRLLPAARPDGRARRGPRPRR